MRLDAEASIKRHEAEAAQARVAAAQTESMYKSERAQWVTSLDAQKFEVRAATAWESDVAVWASNTTRRKRRGRVWRGAPQPQQPVQMQ